MKKRSKSKSERTHAKRRARERFGVNLSEPQFDALIKDIQDNKLEFIERQSNRITVWRGNIQDRDAVIVYDSTRKEIITFIDPNSPLFQDGKVCLELEGHDK